MKNPNGYGSVVRLSGKRRKPFMVRSKATFDARGYPVYSIIGYTTTREEGNMLLAAYNRTPWDVDKAKITLAGLFALWHENKLPKLGKANRAALTSAYQRHCSALYDYPYKQIRAYHMQDIIDSCGRRYATQNTIKNLWRHLDRYALELDIIAHGYSELLTTEATPPTTRDRFSDDEIRTLWAHQHDPWIDVVLILIYSGWRISELLNLRLTDISLSDGTMKGGTKTEAGKNRIVPIHSLIAPLVQSRYQSANEYLIESDGKPFRDISFRREWTAALNRLDIHKTPHECRHTFESLLDAANANRKCIDLMMGHVSKDTGNRIYNHKTLEDLKRAIEMVKLN